MILQVLLRNEFLKARKMVAFRMTWLICTGFATAGFLVSYRISQRMPERPFALPGAWSQILGGQATFTLVFAAVGLMLLTGQEFQWRTARQNVIDGLSKEEFFLAKAVLIPLITVLFIGSMAIIGGGFALAGTDRAALTEPLVRSIDAWRLAGLLLVGLGYLTLALFFALHIRNPASAMAIWLVYVLVLERLVGALLVRASDSMKPVVRLFPATVFTEIPTWFGMGAEQFQRAVERAASVPNAPEVWHKGPLALAAVVWMAVLLAVSFVTFRKRDL